MMPRLKKTEEEEEAERDKRNIIKKIAITYQFRRSFEMPKMSINRLQNKHNKWQQTIIQYLLRERVKKKERKILSRSIYQSQSTTFLKFLYPKALRK
jgi:hypothetical protein